MNNQRKLVDVYVEIEAHLDDNKTGWSVCWGDREREDPMGVLVELVNEDITGVLRKAQRFNVVAVFDDGTIQRADCRL